MTDLIHSEEIQLFRKMGSRLPGGVLVYAWDDGKLLYANTEASRLFGCPDEETLFNYAGGYLRGLIPEDDYAEFAGELKDNDVLRAHETIHLYAKIRTAYNRQFTTENFLLLRDTEEGSFIVDYITRHVDEQARASLDRLTGFYNMAGFLDKADAFIEENQRAVSPLDLAIVWMDIRDFKLLNGKFGMSEGDRILVDVADLIREEFPNAITARFSGDHFVILCGYRSAIAKAQRVYVRTLKLRRQENEPVVVRAGMYHLSVNEPNLSYACDCAKMASDHIKNSYDRTYCIYDESFQKRIQLENYIATHVEEAIAKKWIQVYLQPVVRAYTQEVCGYEALSRWNDPQYGMLAPNAFIPVLEEKGLIPRLDAYVVEEACALLAKGIADHEVVEPLSFNLTYLDFENQDIFHVINSIADEYGVPHSLLHIEITESTLNRNPVMLRERMKQFHEAGYQIWMDDFGSGYSSLNILREFDFDRIKIDMEFMRNFSDRSRSIVESIVHLAKNLGMASLCEGVETKEQFEFLREAGCDMIQGYYFSKPLPADRVDDWLREQDLFKEPTGLGDYYNAIGEVDLLSARPVAESGEAGGIPYGILEETDGLYHFITTNAYFKAVLKSFGDVTIQDLEDSFNDASTVVYEQVRQALSAQKHTGDKVTCDFTVNGYPCEAIARRIAAYPDRISYLLTISNLNVSSEAVHAGVLKDALPLLYSVFDQVGLLDLEKDRSQTLFSSSLSMKEYDGLPLHESAALFASRIIARPDQSRFIQFVNKATLEDRLRLSHGGMLDATFRVQNDTEGKQKWIQLTMLKTSLQDRSIILYCSRNADELMAGQLSSSQVRYSTDPEIGRIAFSDVLLVAGRGLANLLGYTWFRDLIDNSTVIKANLSENRIIDGHYNELAGQDYRYTDSDDYDAVCGNLMKAAFGDEPDHPGWQFFDRRHLMEEFKEGRIFDTLVYSFHLNGKTSYRFACVDTAENGSGIEAIILIIDSTRFHSAGAILQRRAELDTLTGLYNRFGCDEHISTWLGNNQERTAGMVVLDLDDFKVFNDTWGHDLGDEVLRSAAKELRLSFPDEAVLARSGGDEFMVLLEDRDEHEVIEELKAFTARSHSFIRDRQTISYSFSIGYAMFPEHGIDYETLIRKADTALYAAKLDGKGTFRGFRTDQLAQKRDQLSFSLRDVMKGIPGAFLIYRADPAYEEILFANDELIRLMECDSLQDLLKYTRGTFEGMVYPEDLKRVEEEIRKQVQSSREKMDFVQYRIITRNGSIRHIADIGRLVDSPHYGKIFYVFLHDLDRQKKTMEDAGVSLFFQE